MLSKADHIDADYVRASDITGMEKEEGLPPEEEMPDNEVEKAQETANAIEVIRYEDLPIECSECRSALGGSYSEDDEGNALCLECAGMSDRDGE